MKNFTFFSGFGDSKVNRLIWHWNPGWWVDSNWSKSGGFFGFPIQHLGHVSIFFSFTFGGFWIFGSDFFFGRVNHCVHSADRIRKERALNLRRLVFSKAWFIQPLVGFGMWYDHKSILTGHRSNYWGLFVSNLFAEFTSKYYTLEN